MEKEIIEDFMHEYQGFDTPRDIAGVATAKDLESIEEESIVGCLKEGQLCSGFKDTTVGGGRMTLFSTASLEPSQTCWDGGTCSLTQCESWVFLCKN